MRWQGSQNRWRDVVSQPRVSWICQSPVGWDSPKTTQSHYSKKSLNKYSFNVTFSILNMIAVANTIKMSFMSSDDVNESISQLLASRPDRNETLYLLGKKFTAVQQCVKLIFWQLTLSSSQAVQRLCPWPERWRFVAFTKTTWFLTVALKVDDWGLNRLLNRTCKI